MEVLASHHRQMLLALPFATVIVVDDQILAANPHACALLGAELEGTHLSDWMVTDEQPQLSALLAAARHGGQSDPQIMHFVARGGTGRRCEVRVSPWAVEARAGALVTLDDRTEALEHAERERRAARHYRDLFEQSRYPLCILELTEGRIREANQAFRRLIGARSVDLQSFRLADFFLPEPDGGLPPENLLAMLKRGETRGPTELRIRRLDGSATWILATIEPVVEEDGIRRTARTFIAEIDRRKETEAALQASEQRFRDFAASSSDWIWETGIDYRFTFVTGPRAATDGDNMFYRSLLGRTRWEAISADVTKEPWRSHLADLEARRPFRNFRYVFPLSPTQNAYFLVNGIPVFKPDGSFAGYRGTATNETAQVIAEKAMRRTREELTDAIARVPLGIGLFDAEDRLIARNNIERDFGPVAHLIRPGITFEEMLRLGVSAGLLPEANGQEEAFIQARLQRHRNPGPPFIQERDNRWLEVREHRLDNGHTILVQIDITEARRTERALRDSEGKFRSLVEGSVQAVVIHREGRPLFANNAFVQLFGYDSLEEVLALPTIFGLFVPENRDRAKTVHRQRIGGQHPAMPNEYQHEMVRKDGSRFWIESRLSIVDWDGEQAVQATIVDITERRNIERLKNDFISTVSHELRTPLTSIAGSLGLISGGMAGPISDKAQRLIEIAASNSDRLVRLINSILDIEKIESGRLEINFERLSAVQLVTQAIEVNRGFADEYGIDLVLEEPAATPWIQGGSDQLIQVLTNLLSNAIKFSPPRGVVRLAVRRRGNTVRFSVRDLGPGIPEEFRGRVFDKFTQADSSSNRRHTGTGLGLSICRALVERHGGTIDFHTQLGLGTEFYFDLPETGIDTSRNRRILVCEDEPDVATLIGLLLEQEGMEPEIVHRAADARHLLQQHEYAALTIDLSLPDMPGLDLLREVRATPHLRDLPIIVLSATARMVEAISSGEKFARTAWLNKPIDRRRLTETLNAFIGQRANDPDTGAPS